MKAYIGIDPGLDGGFAVVDHDGNVLAISAPPTTSGKPREYLERQMVELVDHVPLGSRAAIEYAQAMPKQGVRSMFSIGLGYGLWRGILAGAGVPYDIIRPPEWRKAVGLPAKADKGASVALAQRLFPAAAAQLVGPRGGARDGLAEALLIAEARRRIG